MSKKVGMPWASMIGMGAAMFGFWGLMSRDDRHQFNKRVKDKGITDPREVWDECIEYHKEMREELSEARAKLKAGEDLVRVAKGLEETRKMMMDFDPPVQVKQSIIAHWWTEMMKLFVPWGLVLPGEIDPKKSKYFRLAGLVDPQRREAELRAMVYTLKRVNETQKDTLDVVFNLLNEEGEVENLVPGLDDKVVTIRVRRDIVRGALDRHNAEKEKKLREKLASDEGLSVDESEGVSKSVDRWADSYMRSSGLYPESEKSESSEEEE